MIHSWHKTKLERVDMEIVEVGKRSGHPPKSSKGLSERDAKGVRHPLRREQVRSAAAREKLVKASAAHSIGGRR